MGAFRIASAQYDIGTLGDWADYEAKVARWRSFQDIKRHYSSADVLPHHRVVFNLKGNHYRLVVRIHYNTGIVFIRFIGTHAEYDRIDPTTH